jgi:hypothetical protein
MALSTTMAQTSGVPLFNPAATTTSNIIDTIDFALPHNDSFLHTLLSDINTLIKTNGKLDPVYSGIQTRGYPVNSAHEYAGKYILNWAFRLNRATNHIPPFSKLVLKVPKSWVSPSVGLRFSEMRVSVEHNGFVYYELNNQRAETNLPAGNYSTTPTITTTPEPTPPDIYEDAIIYTCDPSSNLIKSESDHREFLTWPITLAKKTSLSLTQYITVINDAIQTHAASISAISGNPILEFPANTNIASMNADSKFELGVDIRCIYDKSYFTVTVGAGDLLTRLNFLVGDIESTITEESTFQDVSVIEVNKNITMCSIQLTTIGVQHLANYNRETTSQAVPVPFIHSEPVPEDNNKKSYSPSALVAQINQSFLAFTWNTKNVFFGTTLVLQNIGNNQLKAFLTLQTQLVIVEEE